MAGHINGRFAQLDWTPLRYINRAITRRQLSGLYRMSRIGFVTPLRDGMNLVAKAYVAAPDPNDPGVMALSRFAGSVKKMQRLEARGEGKEGVRRWRYRWTQVE